MRLILKIILGLTAAVVLGIFLLYAANALLGIGEKGTAIVPNLKGKTIDQAQRLLRGRDLSFNIERWVFSAKVPKGEIIRQNFDPGMGVKDGREIQVVVSQGPEIITVPDVRGYAYQEAELQLESARLQVGPISYLPSPYAKKGIVIGQKPSPGQILSKDAVVTLVISSGPPPFVTMPELVGDTLRSARRVLQKVHLKMGQIGWEWDPKDPPGTILSQNPMPNQKVEELAMASIVVSAGAKQNNLPFTQTYITIHLPDFKGEKEVKVWVTDELSKYLAYKGRHNGGQEIRLLVSGFGNTSIVVMLGKKILSSASL
jgi:serine/threonine-protein kinase